MKTGVERIADERVRQVVKEAYDASHDDDHDSGELAWAAVCYAAPGPVYSQMEVPGGFRFQDPWPWGIADDKRSEEDMPSAEDRIRLLEKAGALIAAEIDRLLRVEEKKK